jgi:hypothetical protein
VKELNAAGQADAEGLPTLGRWLGRRQAFGMMAAVSRYKKRGMSWATFCQELAAVSRVSADLLINHLEDSAQITNVCRN